MQVILFSNDLMLHFLYNVRIKRFRHNYKASQNELLMNISA